MGRSSSRLSRKAGSKAKQERKTRRSLSELNFFKKPKEKPSQRKNHEGHLPTLSAKRATSTDQNDNSKRGSKPGTKKKGQAEGITKGFFSCNLLCASILLVFFPQPFLVASGTAGRAPNHVFEMKLIQIALAFSWDDMVGFVLGAPALQQGCKYFLSSPSHAGIVLSIWKQATHRIRCLFFSIAVAEMPLSGRGSLTKVLYGQPCHVWLHMTRGPTFIFHDVFFGQTIFWGYQWSHPAFSFFACVQVACQPAASPLGATRKGGFDY